MVTSLESQSLAYFVDILSTSSAMGVWMHGREEALIVPGLSYRSLCSGDCESVRRGRRGEERRGEERRGV
jgi:hypothetical protein